MPFRSLAALIVAALLLYLLAACDRTKIAELEEGVSTEADVRARFGEPAAIYPEPNGERTLEYPRQPAGTTNYMISIGPDGRMTSLRQVLKPADFAKVVPGLDRDRVRRLLGRPARSEAYALKQEEVWDWRYADDDQVKIFSVTFDRDGRVVATASRLGPGGPGEAPP